MNMNILKMADYRMNKETYRDLKKLLNKIEKVDSRLVQLQREVQNK